MSSYHENETSDEDMLNARNDDQILKLILNNSMLIQGAFVNSRVTAFLKNAWLILSENSNTSSSNKKYFQIYLDKFLCHLKRDDTNQNAMLSHFNLDFIAELCLNRVSFVKLVNYVYENYSSYLDSEAKIKMQDEATFNKFSFFVKILLKNQSHLFESDLHMYDELNALADKHITSLLALAKMIKLLLTYLAKCDYDLILANESSEFALFANEKRILLIDFLLMSFKYKPLLFKLVFRLVCHTTESKLKMPKYLKKFASHNETLAAVCEYCLGNTVDSFESDSTKNEEKSKEKSLDSVVKLANSTEQLMANYGYTMSGNDRLILSKLYKLDASLNVLMFKLNENTNSKATLELLNKQAKITDFIALKLDEHKIQNTIQNYPISRKLSDLTQESLMETEAGCIEQAKVYDPVYLLPNIFNLLNYANIVDVIRFVQSRCLSFLLASLTVECDRLRSLAYASLHLFVSHLENSHAYFRNIVLYLINLLRNSVEKENQRIPSIVSVFLAETVMVIIEPGTTLYKPIVQFLLLKPTLDLTNVPEFYKLFNSSSLQYKTERKWILNILSYSCRTSLDYRIFEKRFVYRQLLAIYSSKLGEFDIKLSILHLIYKTCKCKFALIDLVRKHYLLVWMSGVLEASQISQTDNDMNIFFKLLQIFNLIWLQLGNAKSQQEDHAPPITFLNQMYVLMKIFLKKLTSLQALELKVETVTSPSSELKIASKKQEIETFFGVKNQLVDAFKAFDFNLVQFEFGENLDKQFKDVLTASCESESQVEFSQLVGLIEAKKRKFSDLSESSSVNTLNKKAK